MFSIDLKQPLDDPAAGAREKFAKDPREMKIFLSDGTYLDGRCSKGEFGSVKKILDECVASQCNPRRQSRDGDSFFLTEVGMLILGEDFYNDNFERIYAAQTDGGTSALHIAGENIHKYLDKKIYLSNPTWSKPGLIFERAGLDVFFLPYFDFKKNWLDFEGYFMSIDLLPERSIVVMHPACHNPTGVDPSKEQWKELCSLFKKKKIIPFFDFAYQGFGLSVEDDAFSVRLFAENCEEMFITYTCSKNFALHGENTGALFYIGPRGGHGGNVGEQIRKDARTSYANLPTLGQTVVARVLTDPKLRNEWMGDLMVARERLSKTRNSLAGTLSSRTGRDYSYLTNQKGLFSILDLSDEQAVALEQDYGIYLAEKGRANLTGINESNLEYFVSSIVEVI